LEFQNRVLCPKIAGFHLEIITAAPYDLLLLFIGIYFEWYIEGAEFEYPGQQRDVSQVCPDTIITCQGIVDIMSNKYHCPDDNTKNSVCLANVTLHNHLLLRGNCTKNKK
jgi:hypothetical protein